MNIKYIEDIFWCILIEFILREFVARFRKENWWYQCLQKYTEALKYNY